ncbi:hypothetical protein GCM10023235_39300 [Kitasatospora terrestris]|uniref:DUF6457 domain-containing protein n=1 Tax=Kitasatospora terrestris TaxID=258051 RepID=A0ABP9DX38_9ACTN
MERTLDDWIAEVSTELGIELDVDVRGLLDLTRVVAHGVDRPAAPLTAFLVGYAAAQRGGGAAAVAEASAKAGALAERWVEAARPPAAPPTGQGAGGAGPAGA